MPKSCIGYNYYKANFNNYLMKLTGTLSYELSLDTYATWNVIANILENAIEVCSPAHHYVRKNANTYKQKSFKTKKSKRSSLEKVQSY